MGNPDLLHEQNLKALNFAILGFLFLGATAGAKFAVHQNQRGLATSLRSGGDKCRFGELSSILILLKLQLRMLLISISLGSGIQVSENFSPLPDYVKQHVYWMFPENALSISLFLTACVLAVAYHVMAPKLTKRIGDFFRGLG